MTLESTDSRKLRFARRLRLGFGSTDTIYRSRLKRAVDILSVVATAPIVLPLVIVFAGICLAQGVSPFYRQVRLGRGGREFRIVKLRTMVADADAALAAVLDRDPLARAEWDQNQKLRQDPRVTRFGRLLRRSSLDELPQMWNVLRGDMSIVGPRPMMVEQRPLYLGTAYFELRPGITGSWQISKRNDCSFAERAAFDADYHQRLSLRTDLGIMARTVVVMLRGTGF